MSASHTPTHPSDTTFRTFFDSQSPFIELLFGLVETVFVALRSEELGIAT